MRFSKVIVFWHVHSVSVLLMFARISVISKKFGLGSIWAKPDFDLCSLPLWLNIYFTNKQKKFTDFYLKKISHNVCVSLSLLHWWRGFFFSIQQVKKCICLRSCSHFCFCGNQVLKRLETHVRRRYSRQPDFLLSRFVKGTNSCLWFCILCLDWVFY